MYLRNIKRREQKQAEGTSHLSRDKYYNDDHGYWTEEQAMIQSDQRHIVNTNDFEKTVARSQKRQQIGGKKRVTSQNIDDIQSTTTRRSREFWGRLGLRHMMTRSNFILRSYRLIREYRFLDGHRQIS